MKLSEWTRHYIKFQDCMKKQILEITELESGYLVQEKKETKKYTVQETITAIPEGSEKQLLVCLNSQANVNFCVEHWNTLAAHENLIVLFVNTKSNEKWHLHAAQHQKISEDIKKSLEILHTSIPSQEK